MISTILCQTSASSISLCRALPFITSSMIASVRCIQRCSIACRRAVSFCNLERVASPTKKLHLDFLSALGRKPEEDDPSNKLASAELQLCWFEDIGFVDAECFWKWRELALLAGYKPST